MRRTVFVLLTVLALALVACGGDEEEPAATGGTGSTTGTGSTGSTDCPDLSAGDTFTITIANLAFEPDCLTARAAQGITIVNEDSVEHTFTIDGTPIDVTIAGGETFNGEPVSGVVAPGTYDFSCRIHPSMTGSIAVT
jgi:plastocyanin